MVSKLYINLKVALNLNIMRSVLIISLLFIHSVIRASTIVNPRTNTPIVVQGG